MKIRKGESFLNLFSKGFMFEISERKCGSCVDVKT